MTTMLRGLFRFFGLSRPTRQRPALRRFTYRPRLEVLEDRFAPAGSAPSLAPIADLTVPASQQVLQVPLSATDPDGDPVTFSATARSQALVLDGQLGLRTDGGNLYENWGGRGEKWLLDAGGRWYFILPTGELYRWDGSSQATGTLVARVGAGYCQRPALLYDAQQGQALATLRVTGSSLSVSRDIELAASLVITVTASDGQLSDSRSFTVTVAPGEQISGPWNLQALRQPPQVTFIQQAPGLSSLYYEGEPYQGRPTRVYANLARPVQASGRLPAVVLVSGGSGTIFPQWVEQWAQRGYVVLTMDLAGRGPDGSRHPDAGPPADANARFWADRVEDFWPYHAVANIIRGVSLLAARPDVDPERIAVTGISWGGFLTCTVAGLDDRVAAAVSVYGSGFIYEDSEWAHIFQSMSEERRRFWIGNFEPSRYLGQARMPVLFAAGTTDGSYPPGIFEKSYRLVQDRALRVTTDFSHDHASAFAIVEPGLFVDQHLRGGSPLARVGPVTRQGGQVQAPVQASVPIASAALNYTTDTGPWGDRTWHTEAATFDGTTVGATLPTQRPLVCFLTVTDQRGATVSTEYATVVV